MKNKFSNLLKSIIKNKGLILFSIFKYAEVAVTTVTTFLMAKKIGPTELGLAMPVLLYITYANYLSMGINQVVIKNYSRFEDKTKIINFLKVNLQYHLIICIVNVILAFFILDTNTFLFAALVSAGSLLRSYFMAYYRVIDKIHILNKNNLIFSIVLMLSTIFFVTTLKSYLQFWALSFGIALIFYFVDDIKMFGRILSKIIEIPSKEDLLYNLKEGIKLAATGFIATILLTSDRMIISHLHLSLTEKGSYQLGDYSGTAFYLFFTTVIFYFYPKLINKLRNNPEFLKKYVRYMKISVLILPFLLILVYFAAWVVSHFFFSEYPDLTLFITSSVLLKAGVILTTSWAVCYIAQDRELDYIKSFIIPIIAYGLLSVIFIYISISSVIFVPISLSLVLFAEFFRKIIVFERNK